MGVLIADLTCRLGAEARPHLMVTHYTELEHTKGLVLVRGDVLSPHIVSVPEVRSNALVANGSPCRLNVVGRDLKGSAIGNS